MKWLFVGSSPTAPAAIASRDWSDCQTITTNAGFLLRQPDVYFLNDQIACQKYRFDAHRLKEAGCRMVTLHREVLSLKQRGLDWFDEFVSNGRGEPTAKTWGEFRLSGPWCWEYALRNGSTELHLIGCEGYSRDALYFHTPHGSSKVETKNVVFSERLNLLCRLFSAVRFVLYGQPRYEVSATNLEIQCV